MKRSIAIAVSLCVLVAVPSVARAVCTSTATHFCVGHNGTAYTINGTVQMPLTLEAGTAYVFEAASAFSFHPFIITSSATGGVGASTISLGITGTDPINDLGETLTFTPTVGQIGSLFYQCNNHTSMGAGITIVAAGTNDLSTSPADMSAAGTNDMFAPSAADMVGVADFAGAPDLAGTPPAGKSSCAVPSGAGAVDLSLWALLAIGIALTVGRRFARR